MDGPGIERQDRWEEMMGMVKQSPNTLHREKKQKGDRNDDEKSGSDPQTEVSVVGMMKV